MILSHFSACDLDFRNFDQIVPSDLRDSICWALYSERISGRAPPYIMRFTCEDIMKSARNSMQVFTGLLLCIAVLSAFDHPFVKESAGVYRGDTPSIERVKELHSKGFRSVVNVRTNEKEKIRDEVKRLGMKYVHIPAGAFMTPDKQKLRQYVHFMSQKENQPVYVFCAGGRDRSNFFIAVYRVAVDGISPEQAIAEMKQKRVRMWMPGTKNYPKVIEEYASELRQIAAKQSTKEVGVSPRAALSVP